MKPRRQRIVALLPGVLALTLAGCLARHGADERSRLSGEIQQRTGHTLDGAAVAVTNQMPPGVAWADGISADEAVSIALWNNAAFHENLSKLGLARADLAQAGLLANPTFSILFPLGPKQLEFAATFPLEAVWLRPRRVALARLDAERVAAGLVQSGLDLARDVRADWSDLALARDRARLGREAVTLRERIARITAAQQRGGEASELDTAAATAELTRARAEARRLEHEVAVAQERLRHRLGLTDAVPNAVFTDDLPDRPALTLSLEALEQRALAARPDLRASELAVEAAGKRAGLAWAELFALSGVIDANAAGKQGFEIGPGAALPIPIFNQNQAGRARAAAELERAAWNAIGTQQRIRLEVREARIKYQQAVEAEQRWTAEVVPALVELVRRSEQAFELGEMSPLAVQENAKQLVTARVRQAELSAEARRAWAELERSVGTRLSPEPP